MENVVEILMEWATAYGLKIVGAIALLVIGRIVVGILTGVVKRLMNRSKNDETLTKFVVSLTKIALMTFVFIAVLGTLGVQTASFVAVIGAAGLAIGFALQGIIVQFCLRCDVDHLPSLQGR